MSPNATVLHPADLSRLFDSLKTRGYRIVGPTVRDGAIVYDELSGADELPAGWSDEQDAGKYRLKRRDDAALFGYAAGPHSWKKFLFPPATRLWSAKRNGMNFYATEESDDPPKFAFIGVRSCELAATMGDAMFGRTLLWALVLGAFFKFVLSEGLARWPLATGTTALEGWAHHLAALGARALRRLSRASPPSLEFP